MIENYKFGDLRFSGKNYNSDLIIYPDKVLENWWRKEGHNLFISDLKEIENYQPDILLVGRGYMGIMSIDDSVKKYCDDNNIKLISGRTSKIVEEYNKYFQEKTVVCALHLTC